MFPISCNAFGDIVAVAQTIYRIVAALNETRGASEDYRAFIQELHSTASVMEEAHRLMRESDDNPLRDAVLDEVRRCCLDLQRAAERTTGFEALMSPRAPATSDKRRLRDQLSQGTKKLQWHFMRSSEAADFVQCFHIRSQHIQTLLVLFVGQHAQHTVRRQQVHTDASVALIRDDIVLSSQTHYKQIDGLARGLRATFIEGFVAQESHGARQHAAILGAVDTATRATSSTLAEGLRAMNRQLEKQSQSISHISVGVGGIEHGGRFMLIAFPILLSWFVIVVVESDFAAPGTRWHSRTLWSAICALVLYSLWLSTSTQRAYAIPAAIRYGGENSIIFIDFVGSSLHLPLELCGPEPELVDDRVNDQLGASERAETSDSDTGVIDNDSAFGLSQGPGHHHLLTTPAASSERREPGPGESFHDFKLVHVLHVITQYSSPERSFATLGPMLLDPSLSGTTAVASDSLDSDLADDSEDSDSRNVRVEGFTPNKPVVANNFTPSWPAVVESDVSFKWERGEMIRKGNYGRIYLAVNVETGAILAVKQVHVPLTASARSDDRQANVVKALKLECNTLKSLDHPNIVKYLGFEETQMFLNLFFEYMPGGSIGEVLRAHGRFDEDVTRSFTCQILRGLAYIHSKCVVHRDIRGDNILIDQDGVCKISDFGLATHHTEPIMEAMQGTLFWMAPEVVCPGLRGYNSKIDIWSIGCVVLEMWTGERPWSDDRAMDVIIQLYSRGQAPPVSKSLTLSDVADDFRQACFTVNSDDRPSAAELERHPYLVLPPDWTFTGFTQRKNAVAEVTQDFADMLVSHDVVHLHYVHIPNEQGHALQGIGAWTPLRREAA